MRAENRFALFLIPFHERYLARPGLVCELWPALTSAATYPIGNRLTNELAFKAEITWAEACTANWACCRLTSA